MIWAIMEHDYEGKFLVAVFTTEALAKAYLNVARTSPRFGTAAVDWDIEPCDLDPDPTEIM